MAVLRGLTKILCEGHRRITCRGRDDDVPGRRCPGNERCRGRMPTREGAACLKNVIKIKKSDFQPFDEFVARTSPSYDIFKYEYFVSPSRLAFRIYTSQTAYLLQQISFWAASLHVDHRGAWGRYDRPTH